MIKYQSKSSTCRSKVKKLHCSRAVKNTSDAQVVMRRTGNNNQSINDFPDHDKQRHYDLQNNYIRDFPNRDKQSWTRLDRLIV